MPPMQCGKGFLIPVLESRGTRDMNSRFIWAAILLSQVLAIEGAIAEEPQAIAVRVKLDDELRARFRRTDFEKTLAQAVVTSVREHSHWFVFCWPLVVSNEGMTNPDGEIVIELEQ